jgi:iron-sulfur cluster repair protein YtfE (RIC family)
MNQSNILKRQHKDIKRVIEEIEVILIRSNVESAIELASKVNQLAGMLKVHLSSEDKYMYPNLLNSEKKDIQLTAKVFVEEMGTMGSVFETYKQKYNTASKISNNLSDFKEVTRNVLKQLTERLKREDEQLYVLMN